MRLQLSYILLIVTLIGCGGAELTSEDVIGNSGHFHGAEMGENLDQTSGKLQHLLVGNTNSVVTGIIEKAEDRTVVYRLEFSNDQLVAIQLDIFTRDEAEKLRLSDDLTGTLNGRFGEPNSRSGFTLWQDTLNTEQTVEYAFSDESAEYGTPKLSLTIYTFDR